MRIPRERYLQLFFLYCCYFVRERFALVRLDFVNEALESVFEFVQMDVSNSQLGFVVGKNGAVTLVIDSLDLRFLHLFESLFILPKSFLCSLL